MPLMLSPSDLGLPSPAAHPSAMVGQSILQALMGKHGISMPAPGAAAGAPTAAPKVGVDLSDPGANAGAIVGDMAVDIPGGNAPAGDPGAGGLGAADLQKFADSASVKPRTGFLDRIGDFLHSDEGRATMMRFAAGAANGLGGGLAAATSYADQRRKDQAAGAQQATENAFKTQELGDSRQWHLGQLDNEAAQNAETARHNRSGETNDEYRTTSENWRSGQHERGETYRTGVTQQHEDYRTGLTVGEQQHAHDTPSGDTLVTQGGETFRQQHPVATPARPIAPTLQTHVHYTTTPEEYARNGPRLKPSQVQPNGGPAKISSDAEYNSLPSGAQFVGPDGQVRVKP